MTGHETKPSFDEMTLEDSARAKPKRVKGQQREGICAYCSAKGPITKDHVFAQTLFLTPAQNMITVPACQTCHDEKSQGEETLRTFINVEINGSRHPDAEQHVEKAARATLRRQSQLGRAIWEQGKIENWITDAGINLGQILSVPFDGVDKSLLTTIKYMIRGLYYHETHQRLPKDKPVEVAYLQPLRVRGVLDTLHKLPNTHVEEKENGVAGWVSWRPEDAPTSTMWLLCFNRAVYFLGWTGTIAERRRQFIEQAAV